MIFLEMNEVFVIPDKTELKIEPILGFWIEK